MMFINFVCELCLTATCARLSHYFHLIFCNFDWISLPLGAVWHNSSTHQLIYQRVFNNFFKFSDQFLTPVFCFCCPPSSRIPSFVIQSEWWCASLAWISPANCFRAGTASGAYIHIYLNHYLSAPGRIRNVDLFICCHLPCYLSHRSSVDSAFCPSNFAPQIVYYWNVTVFIHV